MDKFWVIVSADMYNSSVSWFFDENKRFMQCCAVFIVSPPFIGCAILCDNIDLFIILPVPL